MAVGDNEQARIEFIRSAINEHRDSAAYKTAADAEEYYNGLNPTINRYEKIIYDMQGRAHTDMWTANHKLASRFFGLVVDQEVSYLLGNGVFRRRAVCHLRPEHPYGAAQCPRRGAALASAAGLPVQ